MREKAKKKWTTPEVKEEEIKNNQSMDCDNTSEEGCGWAGRFR